jgi:hypothetical protein
MVVLYIVVRHAIQSDAKKEVTFTNPPLSPLSAYMQFEVLLSLSMHNQNYMMYDVLNDATLLRVLLL